MRRARFLSLALLFAALGLAERAPAAEIPPSGTLDLRILSDLRLSGDLAGAGSEPRWRRRATSTATASTT